MKVSERWEPSKLHGKYIAVATLHSSNYPIQERVEFVIGSHQDQPGEPG